MVLSSDLEDFYAQNIAHPEPPGMMVMGFLAIKKRWRNTTAKPIHLHKMPARREQGGVKVEGRFWHWKKATKQVSRFHVFDGVLLKKTAQNNGPNGWNFHTNLIFHFKLWMICVVHQSQHRNYIHSVSAYLQSFDGNTSTNTSGGLPFGEYVTKNPRNSKIGYFRSSDLPLTG